MRAASFYMVVRWVAPLFLAFMAACSSDADAVDKRLSKLRDEIAHLQSENDRMAERLDAVEMNRTNAHDAEEKVAMTSSSTTLVRPKLKVVRVEPGGELGVAESADADPVADAIAGPRVVIQGEGKTLETRTLPALPTAAKTTPKAPKPEAAPAK